MLSETSNRLYETSQLANNGFGEMKTHQKLFLDALKQDIASLGESMCDHVEGIEKQADEWLRKYSSEVNTQVTEIGRASCRERV